MGWGERPEPTATPAPDSVNIDEIIEKIRGASFEAPTAASHTE